MSRIAFVVALGVAPTACTADEPPFTFRVDHFMGVDPPVTLLEMQFANYSAGKNAGPLLVDVTEGGMTATLAIDVGFCEQVASCAGPISLEQLVVSLQHPGLVASSRCVGLDGTRNGGIDSSGTGDCAD